MILSNQRIFTRKIVKFQAIFKGEFGGFYDSVLKGKPIVLRSKKKKAERSAEMKDFRKLSFFGFTLPEALNS